MTDETPVFDFSTYLSPFTWRYGSEAMRTVWSETYKRLSWRRVWAALAETQAEFGLIAVEAAAEVQAHVADVDVRRAMVVEQEIHHDLMAELRVYAEQCPHGGGGLHLGATSADIQDNADALRLREALELLLDPLEDLLLVLAGQIERWADFPCMAYTHIQPAEPTTVGYRLAQYGQDLLLDWEELRRVHAHIRGKGIKGAVGTAASFHDLLADTEQSPADLEKAVMARLGLEAFPVTTQTYPRKQDWLVLNALAGTASSLHKMMLDLRILQTPQIGEWAEPFGASQVGSSAMPFKRNPVTAEKIDSLARWIGALPRLAWDNAALAMLERTLDDSANRRMLLPEAFLALDEILIHARRVVRGLRIHRETVAHNLAVYGMFAAVERILMALGKAGADRQVMHDRLRGHSMVAWEAVAAGRANPLCELLKADPTITQYIAPAEIEALMDVSGYVGDAPQRALLLAATIRQQLREHPEG